MRGNKILTVSEVSFHIQKLLDDDPLLSNLWIRGEISNFKHHPTGHFYFSLKDKECTLRAVMFKSKTWRLNFLPKDGMDCLVRGYVSLYPKDTVVQLYAEEIIPAGVGLQALALAELKEKLQKKGYFAPERKKPIPYLPGAIGVVTSPAGAAIRDIYRVVQKRYPGMPVILFPAGVQGEKAAQSIVEGIRALNGRKEIDVIIVARGGGSAEDLSVFNVESVADAVFASTKPIVSAIGHEIDWTITDLVADVRAATPSMAGELVVPVRWELENSLSKYKERLLRAARGRMERENMRLAYLKEAGVMKKPERWLNRYQDYLSRCESSLYKSTRELHGKAEYHLHVIAGRLHALSPLATLGRGYSLCQNSEGKIVTEARHVSINEQVKVRLYKGSLGCIVVAKEEECD
ncbi:MAG: xseA2 [Peptococcaceae bacterium]|jgi:exodeoxyribonuclease VII large subunit|nr:xseA2 [Peptococcaceae bacterium]